MELLLDSKPHSLQLQKFQTVSNLVPHNKIARTHQQFRMKASNISAVLLPPTRIKYGD